MCHQHNSKMTYERSLKYHPISNKYQQEQVLLHFNDTPNHVHLSSHLPVGGAVLDNLLARCWATNYPTVG